MYGLSPAATKNWEKLSEAVKQSDMPQAEKARILDIMSSTAPGPEREEALRALDQGETWKKISTILLPKLLLDMEPGEMSGSGMSFYYEPSPAAKARAAALQQEEQERRLAEERRKQQVQDSLREVQQARERAEQQAELQRQREARQQARKLHPLLAVKTDAVFWAGVIRRISQPSCSLPVGGLSSWVEVMPIGMLSGAITGFSLPVPWIWN